MYFFLVQSMQRSVDRFGLLPKAPWSTILGRSLIKGSVMAGVSSPLPASVEEVAVTPQPRRVTEPTTVQSDPTIDRTTPSTQGRPTSSSTMRHQWLHPQGSPTLTQPPMHWGSYSRMRCRRRRGCRHSQLRKPHSRQLEKTSRRARKTKLKLC